jgi:amidophosphoribosyltransferase
MVTHVYDVTYGTVRPATDHLVVIDDSIVRGTTLKNSIIKMLDRLQPRSIIVVSSAPQIRYPDCYGIDMARIGDLVAFKAAIELLEEHNLEHVIDEVYERCKEQIDKKVNEMKNFVKMIYQPFSDEQIADKIANIVKPKGLEADLKIIFQKIEDLHRATPGHTGDWYFSGNYPTPGGNKVVSKAFINYMEGINERAY